MINDEVEILIGATVAAKQGVKATELIVDVAEQIPAEQELPDILGMIEKLVHEGKLAKIEYVVPSQPNNIKSFLLPMGTKVIHVVIGHHKFVIDGVMKQWGLEVNRKLSRIEEFQREDR
jgi:hypothetical protein